MKGEVVVSRVTYTLQLEVYSIKWTGSESDFEGVGTGTSTCTEIGG